MPTADSDNESLLSCLDMQTKREIAISQQSNNYVRIYSIELNKNWKNGSLLLPELKTGSAVAMKEITRGTQQRSATAICEMEYNRLKNLSHESIVIVYEASLNIDPNDPSSVPFYLMEIGECSLNFLICSRLQDSTLIVPTLREGSAMDPSTNIYYTRDHFFVWLKQVADGILYLHGNGLIHRDVKGLNVLVFDKKTKCKLCDFDTCREIDLEGMTPKVGTDRWRAPELRKPRGGGRVTYNKTCDGYSFGVLICEALFRELPFSDYPENAFNVCDADIPDLPPAETIGAMLIDKTGERPRVVINKQKSVFSDIPSSLWNLLEGLLSWTAEDRPSFEDVCRILQPMSALGRNLPAIIVNKDRQRTDTGSLANNGVASRHRRYHTKRVMYSMSNSLNSVAQDRMITVLREFSGNINVMAEVNDAQLENVRHEYSFEREDELIHDIKSVDQQLVDKVFNFCFGDINRKFTEQLAVPFKYEPNLNLRGMTFAVVQEQNSAEN